MLTLGDTFLEGNEAQSWKNSTVTRSLAGGRSTKYNKNSFDNPKPCLFCFVF